MEKEMRKEMKVCIGEKKMRKRGIGQEEGYYSILKANILHHCFLSCLCKLPYLIFNPFSFSFFFNFILFLNFI